MREQYNAQYRIDSCNDYVDCGCNYMNGVSISKMLTTLLVVLIVFYLIGFCVKKLFEKYLVITKEDLAENGESEEDEDVEGEESQEAFEGTEDESRE